MIISVYVQTTPVCSSVPSPNYHRQPLCAPRECSQADSGSRRGPQWPSQNPVAGSTPAGRGACRFAPNDCNGCSVCASDSASPRNVLRLSALRGPAGERPSFLPSFLSRYPTPVPSLGEGCLSLRSEYSPRPSPNAHILKILPVICAQEIKKRPSYGPARPFLSLELHI